MSPRRVRKSLIALLFVIAVPLAMPRPAAAAVYKLPVASTATLVISDSNYFDLGEPGVPYEFYLNPQTLRFGYDASFHLCYESIVIFDRSELLGIPAGPGNVSLHLTPLSMPEGQEYDMWMLREKPTHAAAEPLDFVWAKRTSPGITVAEVLEPYPADYLETGANPRNGYEAWVLGSTSSLVVAEIAGAGDGTSLENLCMAVEIVPEPSSATALGAGILLLLALLTRSRRRAGVCLALLLAASVPMMLAGAARGDDDVVVDSAPGNPGCIGLAAAPTPPSRTPPAGYKYLPAFPRFFWSYGCAPTSGAMIAGYYDNAGFARMFRNADGSDAVCPTGGYPNDNGIFLKSGDDPYMYPSRCAISATEQGVLGRTTRGHVDDYYYQLGSGVDPYYNNWTPHTDDCVADFMGTSIFRFRGNGDGSSRISLNWNTGAQVTWVPQWYPYLNVGNVPLDSTYGLSQYISSYVGYYCRTSHALNSDPFNDVASYYNQSVMGYRPSATDGVTAQDIADEIDAGRPVIAIAVQLDTTSFLEISGMHAFPVFGYKWTTEGEEQRLWMLAYDTWYEDALSQTSYRTVRFQTPTEAQYHANTANTPSLTRQSNSTAWKIYGFSFLKINNNARCPLPLGTSDYPSGAHDDAFDISFSLPGNSRVHYDSWTPTPESPAVTLDTNGAGALHVDQDSLLNFRTYRDATASNDGYLASDVVRRVYSVFSANKNVKKFADGTSVNMVNGIVTHVVDSANFYFEERDKRLFGVRVHKASHGLVTGDEVEVVVGTVETDSSNDERYIDATSVSKTDPPSAVITPYGMKNALVGGKGYLPPGGSGTGYGQSGVKDGQGVNNIGLLVRTAGKVTDIDTNSDCFTISDGSGALDSSSNDGVKISAVGLIPSGLQVGDFVAATGICSAEKVSGDLYPVVVARDSSDLVVE